MLRELSLCCCDSGLHVRQEILAASTLPTLQTTHPFLAMGRCFLCHQSLASLPAFSIHFLISQTSWQVAMIENSAAAMSLKAGLFFLPGEKDGKIQLVVWLQKNSLSSQLASCPCLTSENGGMNSL